MQALQEFLGGAHAIIYLLCRLCRQVSRQANTAQQLGLVMRCVGQQEPWLGLQVGCGVSDNVLAHHAEMVPPVLGTCCVPRCVRT
jgi:hypothetical protein